jgi:hypothetical protein
MQVSFDILCVDATLTRSINTEEYVTNVSHGFSASSYVLSPHSVPLPPCTNSNVLTPFLHSLIAGALGLIILS